MARIIWFPRLYRERPLLARTRIQRCQPSVLSRARAACSMRSRSALRRASRCSSVSGSRLKRRAIVGCFRGLARQRAARSLRGAVEVLVELVAHAVVRLRLGRLTRGALQLADLGLGLVVGGVGALDGLLELAQRRGD